MLGTRKDSGPNELVSAPLVPCLCLRGSVGVRAGEEFELLRPHLVHVSLPRRASLALRRWSGEDCDAAAILSSSEALQSPSASSNSVPSPRTHHQHLYLSSYCDKKDIARARRMTGRPDRTSVWAKAISTDSHSVQTATASRQRHNNYYHCTATSAPASRTHCDKASASA